VCFPHAGGAATFFYSFSAALKPRVDVLAVQYPGRQDRRTHPCVKSVPELVDPIVEALKGWLDRPIALFGHSMGATVAFEVARRLEQEYDTVPAALFVSGRRKPAQQREMGLSNRSDDVLIMELQLLSGTDTRLLDDEEVLRMIVPALRGDYQAMECYRYQPGPNLTCPIIAFTGDKDPKVSIDEARGWSEYTTGPFELQIFSGGHFYIIPQQTDVITAISRRLERVLRREPGVTALSVRHSTTTR
jgi:pyochelin biosynthetic protein PchC